MKLNRARQGENLIIDLDEFADFCNAGFQGTILGYSTYLILIQISINLLWI